jgi:hypothetical protein
MNIDKYKNYIEKVNMECFGGNLPSRYYTLQKLINSLITLPPPLQILELGTIRSFTMKEGACKYDLNYWFPNNPERWDWGSGLFSLLIAEDLPQSTIDTVDITEDNINTCKTYTSHLQNRFNYHTCGSTQFLLKTHKQFDVIYMDHATGDLGETQELHRKDTEIIIQRNLIKSNGFILIDDYHNDSNERCRYSLPYLLNNNFKIVDSAYQILLQKKN